MNKFIKILFSKANYKTRKIIISLLVRFGEKEPWNKEIRALFMECLNIKVGYGTYGAFNMERGGTFPRGTIIGNYCSISDNVKCFAENHPINAISMHPIFYEKSFGLKVDDIRIRNNLTIGHGCWIGYGVIITPGCNCIGNGAVIGAGTIVTKDIPPYAIVVGSPAKIIRYRFNKREIEKIEESKWWNLHCADFNENMAKKVMDIDAFCKLVIENEKS